MRTLRPRFRHAPCPTPPAVVRQPRALPANAAAAAPIASQAAAPKGPSGAVVRGMVVRTSGLRLRPSGDRTRWRMQRAREAEVVLRARSPRAHAARGRAGQPRG